MNLKNIYIFMYTYESQQYVRLRRMAFKPATPKSSTQLEKKEKFWIMEKNG